MTNIKTNIKFVISGQEEEVYEVLSALQGIVSGVSESEAVNIVVDIETDEYIMNTKNPEDDNLYSDEATLRKWEELDASEIDMESIVYLNKLQKESEAGEIEEDDLQKKVNYFADYLFPNLIKKTIPHISKQIEGITQISYENNQNRKIDTFPQPILFGNLNIYIVSDILVKDSRVITETIHLIVKNTIEAANISTSCLKNLKINILDDVLLLVQDKEPQKDEVEQIL